jgi:predicted dehydrogenase
VGLAGCGRAAAELHLPALARVEGVEAVAVMDVDRARARRVAERFGIARVHDDVEALAADVDLVAVCTPPAAHADAALLALAAGRHVLVEKPLTVDLAEADALVEAAEGKVAAVGFNLRVHRQMVAAREALDAGRLGRLLLVRSHWAAGSRGSGWRGGAGGSALWDMGIHHLDLWRLLGGGEPRDLRASGDAATLALSARTDDGVVLATTLATGTADAHEVELVGERGRMSLTLYRGDGPRFAGERLARRALDAAADLPRRARAARGGGDYLLSYAAQWEAIRDAVRGGGSPPATFDDGRAAVALAVEAEDALAREGAPA